MTRRSRTLVTLEDRVAHSLDAGAKRVRPMLMTLMTLMTNVFGLLPILLVGADVAKRIAAPMWGGFVSLTVLTLLVVPAVHVVWRTFHLRRARDTVPAACST